jgi:hypothetical protein
MLRFAWLLNNGGHILQLPCADMVRMLFAGASSNSGELDSNLPGTLDRLGRSTNICDALIAFFVAG